MANPDASVSTINSSLKFGRLRIGVVVRAFFSISNASKAASSHRNLSLHSSLVNGPAMVA